MTGFKRYFFIGCWVCLVAGPALLMATAQAADRTPLLQPGKKTLYQRVLTRPGALLTDEPGAQDGRPIPAFSRFYVYTEREVEGGPWLEVGVDTKGDVKGWLAAAQTAPWQQQMALAFTNPGAKRTRALFFDSWEALDHILSLPQPSAELGPLTESIAAGGRDPRVVAIEPDRHIDINSQFYLLPILDYREVFTEAGFPMRGLKVASVTESAAAAPQAVTKTDDVVQLGAFRAAVVFVIDSTASMQKYIDRARETVRQVYERIKGSSIADQVSFGLVAFRAPSQDPDRAKSLGYVARVFADPSVVDSEQEFFKLTSTLAEAKVSTDAFDEDPYAGLLEALEEIPWNRFGARYAVLITDAGALEGKASVTGLHAAEVRSEAAAKGVAVLVLHLKTPLGVADHGKAQAQYQVLSDNGAIQRSLYFPVQDGSVESLGKAVSALADTVMENVLAASRGELSAGAARTAQDAGSGDAETKGLREAAQALGYAMRLAYLGKQEGTRAPPVFEGWISDRDPADPTVRTVEERVLLTKNQLSDLHGILKQIVDAADAGMLEPDAFFDNLRSIAAQYGRDPSLALRPEATKLADLGLLGEYLDGLPYKSAVMNLDQDTWSRWGTQRQFDFVSQLKGKIRLYERYNADTDRWVSLAEDSPKGEQVYPVPLSDLP